MSAAVRAAHFTKCRCGDWIKPGDSIVFWEDQACHVECEPNIGGWDLPDSVTVVRQLAGILKDRTTLINAAFEVRLDVTALPERIRVAFDHAIAHEGALISLCEDIVSEHRDEKRNQLEEFEQTVLRHEAAARRRLRRGL